jgi:tetratricopeptide (TPR) repeat protein
MKSLLSFLFTVVILFQINAQPGEMGAGEKQPSTEEQLAGQFYQNSEWAKAAELYEKLYSESPVNFYYSQLVNCYLNLKDIKQAEKLINKQIKRYPRQLTYVIDLAYIYQSIGETDKAKKQFEKGLKNLDPFDDKQVIELASAYENRKQINLAIKTYIDAREAAPRAYNFNIELASLYAKQGETEKLLDEYTDLIASQGTNYLEPIQQTLQDMMSADETGTKSEIIREHLLKEIQRNPDNIIYSDLLIWFFVQKKDFESAFIQTKALDKRLKENGKRVMDLARTCISNDQFETGQKAYQYVIDKGAPNDLQLFAKRELSMASYKRLINANTYTNEQLSSLEKLMQSTLNEMEINDQSSSLAIRLGHLKAFYKNETDTALVLLEKFVTPSGGLSLRPLNEVKLEIADIQLLKGDVWESTLTYSQIEKAMKNDTLGQEAKFRNAKLAYYKGEFDWAKAQLDVLKAATTKLIANDALELSLLIGDNTSFDTTGEALKMFSRADLWLYQNKSAEALSTLDSLNTEFPGNTLADDILFRKAKVYIKQGNITDAVKSLETILTSYRTDILADNSLFLLATINEQQLNNPTKAMDLYKELMTDFPGSLFVVEARKRFRTLRGDTVQ